MSSVWNFCTSFSDVIWKEKPVAASPNVSCFLRLAWLLHYVLPSLSKFYARRKGEDVEIIWSKSTFPARQSKWGVIIASRWSVYFSSFVQQKSSSFYMTFPKIDTRKRTLSTLQSFQNLILSCNSTYWKQHTGKKGHQDLNDLRTCSHNSQTISLKRPHHCSKHTLKLTLEVYSQLCCDVQYLTCVPEEALLHQCDL